MGHALTAVAVMAFATIAVHLSLSQAVLAVVAKVCKCHKCLSFWATLVVLLWSGCSPIAAAVLSLSVSYLSNWFGLLLVWLNRKFNELWEKVEKKTKTKPQQ